MAKDEFKSEINLFQVALHAKMVMSDSQQCLIKNMEDKCRFTHSDKCSFL